MDTKKNFQEQARILRAKGASFFDICQELKREIPKSTLSYWCRGIVLSSAVQNRHLLKRQQQMQKARIVALSVHKKQRERYLSKNTAKTKHIIKTLDNPDVALVALAMLYLGEGGKTSGSVVFGNANPGVIRLFLSLLRKCFPLDEKRFRCTVQGRTDQDFIALRCFWAKTTGIPTDQFYHPQIDKRSAGKPTKDPEYKGVCRIDYFSADVFTTLVHASKNIIEGS